MRVIATSKKVSENISISFDNLDELVILWSKYKIIVQKSGLEELEFIINDDLPAD